MSRKPLERPTAADPFRDTTNADLIGRCRNGDRAACAELDARRVPMPMPSLEIAAVHQDVDATRTEVMLAIAHALPGKRVLGAELEEHGSFIRIRFEGGLQLILADDGSVSLETDVPQGEVA